MTPKEFVLTLDPPEEYRRIAVVAKVPSMTMAAWLHKVRELMGNRYDSYRHGHNPMRLQGFIDGHPQPRLSLTLYPGLDGEDFALRGVNRAGLTIIREISQ